MELLIIFAVVILVYIIRMLSNFRADAPIQENNSADIMSPASEQCVELAVDFFAASIVGLTFQRGFPDLALLTDTSDRMKIQNQIKSECQQSDFAIGYIMGYVDGLLQKHKLSDNTERIAVCSLVFIRLFGHDVGAKMIGHGFREQLTNNELQSGLISGGGDAFEQVGVNSSRFVSRLKKIK